MLALAAFCSPIRVRIGNGGPGISRTCIAFAAALQVPDAVLEGDGTSLREIEGPRDSVSCCRMVMGCVITRDTCLAHVARQREASVDESLREYRG